MSGFWPAWVGGVGLATVAVGYHLASGRTVGVSGAWDRILHWREERRVELADEQFDEAAFMAALEAASREEFGESGGEGGSVATAVLVEAEAPSPGPSKKRVPHASGPTPLVAQAAFLLSIFFGGLLAAVMSGRFELRADMGPDFAAIVTGGWAMWPILFIGGVLVGFGTRLAGGCSSGHGLSGCGRLQLHSLVATATFFGTAVVVSTLLWKVI